MKVKTLFLICDNFGIGRLAIKRSNLILINESIENISELGLVGGLYKLINKFSEFHFIRFSIHLFN